MQWRSQLDHLATERRAAAGRIVHRAMLELSGEATIDDHTTTIYVPPAQGGAFRTAMDLLAATPMVLHTLDVVERGPWRTVRYAARAPSVRFRATPPEPMA